METTEDLQTDTVLQSPEIERCKPSISDQGVDVPLDTWAITCVEEHLARLSKGFFAQALSPQRTKCLDQTDTAICRMTVGSMASMKQRLGSR